MKYENKISTRTQVYLSNRFGKHRKEFRILKTRVCLRLGGSYNSNKIGINIYKRNNDKEITINIFLKIDKNLKISTFLR